MRALVPSLYVDGAARGNPGPAGAAAILVDTDGREVFIAKQYLGEVTNNVAEYRALILGLTEAAVFTDRLTVYSDSELVVRQINGEYKVKNAQLKELMAKVSALAAKYQGLEIAHVPRERNARADAAANEAIDEREEAPAQRGVGTEGQERLFDV